MKLFVHTLALVLLCLLFLGCGDSQDFVVTEDPPQEAMAVLGGELSAPQPFHFQTMEGQQLIADRREGLLAPFGSQLQFQLILQPTGVQTTQAGGRLELDRLGGFTYDPPQGFVGTDTFRFSVFGPLVTRRLVATFVVTPNPDGFLVDAEKGNDQTGEFERSRPFRTIRAALDSAGPGGEVQVRSGFYRELLSLQDGQSLVAAPGSEGQVRIGAVTMANGNTLRGLNTPVSADGRENGTIEGCVLQEDGLGSGFTGIGLTGTWNLWGNRIEDPLGPGINIAVGEDEDLRCVLDGNRVSGSGAPNLRIRTAQNAALEVAITGNTLISDGTAIELFAEDNSLICTPIRGNNITGSTTISGAPTAVVQVERLRDLNTLNSDLGEVILDGANIFGVPEGQCGF